jgi:hypothetical protein
LRDPRKKTCKGKTPFSRNMRFASKSGSFTNSDLSAMDLTSSPDQPFPSMNYSGLTGLPDP